MFQNFIVAFEAVVPMFLTISSGYCVKAAKILDQKCIKQINKFFYFWIEKEMIISIHSVGYKIENVSVKHETPAHALQMTNSQSHCMFLR